MAGRIRFRKWKSHPGRWQFHSSFVVIVARAQGEVAEIPFPRSYRFLAAKPADESPHGDFGLRAVARVPRKLLVLTAQPYAASRVARYSCSRASVTLPTR